MSAGPHILQHSTSVDLVSIATDTEGYLAADLKAVVERAMHEGAVRNIRASVTTLGRPADVDGVPTEAVNDAEFSLIQKDFDNARRGFVPSSLRGVKLQSSEVSWADIGGEG